MMMKIIKDLQPLVTSPSLSEVANRNVIQIFPTCQQSRKSLSNDRPSPNMPQIKGVHIKLGKNITRMCLQTGHHKTKDEQRPTSIFHTNNYQNLLAAVQTKILAHHTSLQNNTKNGKCNTTLLMTVLKRV